MPQEQKNVNFSCRRFDFGVPLEDIFPPNDIHPRLKQLFSEAYEQFLYSQTDIEPVLSTLQGSLKDRFKLKEKVVFESYYNCGFGIFSPGTYFWVIRHFLGLLPIPLLPKYANATHFDWSNLSNLCREFLYDFEIHRKKDLKLDFQIAESLTQLPFSHFLLINILIIFMRKISTKFKQLLLFERQYLNRRSVLSLTSYFCSAIFTRPFQPGYSPKKHIMFPLLFYMVIRWRDIRNQCKIIGHPAYYLDVNYELIPTKILRSRECGSQTKFSEVTTPKTLSNNHSKTLLFKENKLFKDVSCQTENHLIYPSLQLKNKPSNESLSQNNLDQNIAVQRNEIESLQNSQLVENYKLAFVEEDINNCPEAIQDENKEISTYFGEEIFTITNENNPFLESTIQPYDQNIDHSIIIEDEVDDNLFTTAIDFSLQSKNSEHWNDVIQETSQTLKKVEEYIYDDYETFKQEDFNQITNRGSKRSSLIEKMSKFGWSYTSPSQTAREKENSKHSSPSDVNSYIKFPDVLDEEVLEHSTKTNLEIPDNVQKSKKTSQFESVRSNSELVQTGSKHVSQKSSISNVELKEKKSNLNFNKIKKKFKFFRSLTPKRSSTISRVVSNVKYQRIKQGLTRSNTI